MLSPLSFLSSELPCIPVSSSRISVLHSPLDFYSHLMSKVQKARQRVTFASLYLGTGQQEQALAQQLTKASKQVSVTMLLDHCRANRINKSDNLSSVAIIDPSIRLQLYHSPALRGFTKRLLPARWNELVGLQHIKVYIVDDDVVMSGANLSKDYFNDRQDRYLCVEKCPKLANFFQGLVDVIGEFSFQRNDQLHPQWNHHPYEGDYNAFVSEARRRLDTYLSEQRRINSAIYDAESDTFKCNEQEVCDTWLFPTVQMGVLGINEDSLMTEKLLNLPSTSFTMGTGYFNPTSCYLDLMLSNKSSNFDLIMAHPLANGFYGASGLSGGIPHAYTHILAQFYDAVDKQGQTERIKLHEYLRQGWTFHGKGLWITPKGDECPIATVIGSSNFGDRSVRRDLEAQLVLVTRSPQLRRALQDEQHRLRQHAVTVTRASLTAPERLVPLWVKAFVKCARNFF